MKEYIRTRHSVYLLTYHMVFVTKWRKPVITDEIGDFMVATAKRLCDGYGGELISGETDRDHIHLLVSLPPSKNITDIVRSLKTQLSKEVHAHPEYDRIVKKHIYGNAPLWSPSYFVATTGSVSMDVVKQNISRDSAPMNINANMKSVHSITGIPGSKKETPEKFGSFSLSLRQPYSRFPEPRATSSV